MRAPKARAVSRENSSSIHDKSNAYKNPERLNALKATGINMSATNPQQSDVVGL